MRRLSEGLRRHSVRFGCNGADEGLCVLNPDESDPVVVRSAGLRF
jgi:hypothetical protein